MSEQTGGIERQRTGVILVHVINQMPLRQRRVHCEGHHRILRGGGQPLKGAEANDDMNVVNSRSIGVEIAKGQVRFDVWMTADVAINHSRLISAFNQTKYLSTYPGQWHIEPNRYVKQNKIRGSNSKFRAHSARSAS